MHGVMPTNDNTGKLGFSLNSRFSRTVPGVGKEAAAIGSCCGPKSKAVDAGDCKLIHARSRGNQAMTEESMSTNDITQSVQERYARAAASGEQMCCPSGYDFTALRSFIPEEVLRISYGCGTPAGLDTVQTGETVLDIGSGGGIDCFEAARLVGPAGRVIGIDMTETMLEIARRNAPAVARNLGYPDSNIEFRKGLADAMPVADASVDLIISNCVINLAPDKPKVFREMFRVLKPGGRFTISDIVSDQPIPQYLLHDSAKWGDCLSGSLQVGDYLTGLTEAGFLSIHQNTSLSWRVIDGIHFLSLTLTGWKLSNVVGHSGFHATLVGPFSQVTDELGRTYRRGKPQPVDSQTAQLLKSRACRSLFLLADHPISLDRDSPRWRSIVPDPQPCVWRGDFAILTGPFREAHDDDGHLYRRGVPLEICSKTLKVLGHELYRSHFTIYNRASERPEGTQVTCSPTEGCC
jgi:arsenite methyltransferase